jgi:hypothetical protein
MAKLPHGERQEISLELAHGSKEEQTNQIERRMFSQQTVRMFQQPPLEHWMIYASSKDADTVKLFMSNLRDTVTTFNYFTKEPRTLYYDADIKVI